MNPLPAVELYSIGTELLMGQIQDTNACWMAQQIARLGGYVRRITILDDDIEEIVGTLKDAIARKTRVIITTGGLGPTPDDLTVEAVARLMDTDIVVQDTIIETFMNKRNVRREDLSPGLVKMATSPRGSRAYPNPVGAAPCIESQIDGTTLFSIPGPPREMKALFQQSIEPAVAGLYSGNRASIRVAVNLPESGVGPLLQSVMQEHPDTYLKAYVALREQIEGGQRLPVDIVARAENEEGARALLDAALASFRVLVEAKGQAVEILE